MIRDDIIECYRDTDGEPDLDQVAARLGSTREALLGRLRSEPPLENLAGLSMDEVLRVPFRFGGFAMFSQDIEKSVMEFVQARFAETREKIQEFERRAREKDKGKN